LPGCESCSSCSSCVRLCGRSTCLGLGRSHCRSHRANVSAGPYLTRTIMSWTVSAFVTLTTLLRWLYFSLFFFSTAFYVICTLNTFQRADRRQELSVWVLVADVSPRDERTQPSLPQDDSQLCDEPEYRCQDEASSCIVLCRSARTRTCSVRLQTRTLPHWGLETHNRPPTQQPTHPHILGILVCRDTCYGFCEGGWARRSSWPKCSGLFARSTTTAALVQRVVCALLRHF